MITRVALLHDEPDDAQGRFDTRMAECFRLLDRSKAKLDRLDEEDRLYKERDQQAKALRRFHWPLAGP